MLVKVAKEEEAECSLNNPTVANNLTVVAGSHLTANQRCVQHLIFPIEKLFFKQTKLFSFHRRRCNTELLRKEAKAKAKAKAKVSSSKW
jgi:hypothetical protein